MLSQRGVQRHAKAIHDRQDKEGSDAGSTASSSATGSSSKSAVRAVIGTKRRRRTDVDALREDDQYDSDALADAVPKAFSSAVTSCVSATANNFDDELCTIVNVEEGTVTTIHNVEPRGGGGGSVDQSYKCPCCTFVSRTRSALERHATEHNDALLFSCLYCSFGTVSEYCMEAHMQRRHAEEITHGDASLRRLVNMCFHPSIMHKESDDSGICVPSKMRRRADSFETRQGSLSDSIARTEDVEIMDLEVDKDTESFVDGSLDGRDSKDVVDGSSVSTDHAGVRTWSCLRCVYTTKRKDAMNTHIMVHANLLRYACLACGMRSNYKAAIKHVVGKSCGKGKRVSLLSEDEARATLASYLRSRCPVSRFRKRMSAPPVMGESTMSTSSTFAVDSSKVFLDRGKIQNDYTELLVSSARVEDEESIKGMFKIKISNRRKFWVCRRCTFRALSKSKYMAHARKNHLKNLDGSRSCCREDPDSKGVVITGDTNDVIVVTDDEATPIATKQGTRTSVTTAATGDSFLSSNTELIDVGGKKMWSCLHCEYNNQSLGNMNHHIETHLEFKRFRCPHCNYRTNFSSNARKHIHLKHSEKTGSYITAERDTTGSTQSPADGVPGCWKVFRCTACGLRSDSNNSLIRHRKSVCPTGSIVCMNLAEARRTYDLYMSDAKFLDPAPSPPAHPTTTSSRSKPKQIETGMYITQQMYKIFRCTNCGLRSDYNKALLSHRRSVCPTGIIERMHPDEARRTLDAYIADPKFLAVNRLSSRLTPKHRKVLQAMSGTKKLRPAPLAGAALGLRRLKCSVCGHRCDLHSSMLRHTKYVSSLCFFTTVLYLIKLSQQYPGACYISCYIDLVILCNLFFHHGKTKINLITTTKNFIAKNKLW